MRKFLINFLFLFVAVLSGIGLFVLKYQVKEKETELKNIHSEILKLKRELHMLEAEWAHLNDPKRLKALVTSQTQWEVIKADQLVHLEDIPFKINEDVLGEKSEKSEGKKEGDR